MAEPEVKATYWAVIGADKPAVNITMATQYTTWNTGGCQSIQELSIQFMQRPEAHHPMLITSK